MSSIKQFFAYYNEGNSDYQYSTDGTPVVWYPTIRWDTSMTDGGTAIRYYIRCDGGGTHNNLFQIWISDDGVGWTVHTSEQQPLSFYNGIFRSYSFTNTQITDEGIASGGTLYTKMSMQSYSDETIMIIERFWTIVVVTNSIGM